MKMDFSAKIKKYLISAGCIAMCAVFMILSASCGADEYDNDVTTMSLKPSETTTEATAASTVQKSTEKSTSPSASGTGKNDKKDSQTEKAKFQYTGKVAQVRAVPQNVSYLDGYDGMRDVTAQQIVYDMRAGITLNEAIETDDGNNYGSFTSVLSYIDMLRRYGYKSVRIPISLSAYFGEDYKVDKQFLKKLHRLADRIIKNNMYCILSIEDKKLRLNSMYDFTKARDSFVSVWRQLATSFKKYNDYLLFEGLGGYDKDNQNISSEQYANFNLLNSSFLKAVRDTGGNNKVRHLIISTYASGYETEQLSNLVVPKDSVKNRIIIDVHLWQPATFCYKDFSDKIDWGTKSDKSMLDLVLYLVNYKITTQMGYPVIIGEYGAADKNNEAQRAKYASYFVSTAYEYKMTCFWYDDGGDYALFDRDYNIVRYEEIVKSVIMSLKG